MHPVLFSLPSPLGGPPIHIYSYGVMLGLSLILGWQLVLHLGEKRDGLDREVMGNAYLVTALCALVGARLLYVVTNAEDFDTPAQWLDVRSGGLVAYGGFLGGFAGAAAYMRRRGMSLLAFGDAAAPAVAAGTGLTRVGCYFYGCDFGQRLGTDAPGWLAQLGTFPNWTGLDLPLVGSPAFLHHVDAYGLDTAASHALPVHPTQLYEALVGFGLLGLCLWVGARRRYRGQVLVCLAFSYAALRFGLEYLRDDPERGMALGFSTSQLISLMLLPAAVLAHLWLSRNRAGQAAR